MLGVPAAAWSPRKRRTWRGSQNGSSGRQIGQVGSEPIQYSGLTRSIRLPISLPISSVTAGGRNGLGPSAQPRRLAEACRVGLGRQGSRRPGLGDSNRYRPLPTRNSARSLSTVRLTRTNMPCVLCRSVTTQRCIPPTDWQRDLDVPRGDPAVDRDPEVPLGAADDEPGLADPDRLAVVLPSSKTVSTATGGREVGRNGLAGLATTPGTSIDDSDFDTGVGGASTSVAFGRGFNPDRRRSTTSSSVSIRVPDRSSGRPGGRNLGDSGMFSSPSLRFNAVRFPASAIAEIGLIASVRPPRLFCK